MEIEVITTSRPGAFPSALRNKRDDVQQDLKDATAALVCSLWERMDGQ
jgi:DNA-directed RNA polymerase I subunit RPA12